MEEKLEKLINKIKSYKEENADKRHIFYPKGLKTRNSQVFERVHKLKVSEFCKKTGLVESTVLRWERVFKFSSSFKQSSSCFSELSLKKDSSSKQVYVLKGLSLEEIRELLGGS